MKFRLQKHFGFTLVELLVVIAIIGILSSVAVVNLNSARDKARTAAVEQTLASLLPIAQLCLSEEKNLVVNLIPDACGAAPEADVPICENYSVVWPDILAEYNWGWLPCASDFTAGTYSYSASENGGAGPRTITCTQTGCVTT